MPHLGEKNKTVSFKLLQITENYTYCSTNFYIFHQARHITVLNKVNLFSPYTQQTHIHKLLTAQPLDQPMELTSYGY